MCSLFIDSTKCHHFSYSPPTLPDSVSHFYPNIHTFISSFLDKKALTMSTEKVIKKERDRSPQASDNASNVDNAEQNADTLIRQQQVRYLEYIFSQLFDLAQ